MTDRPPGTRIIVCRTCDRYAPPPRPGEITRGLELALAVQQHLAARGDDFPLRVVNCLAGCKSPCNVVIDGQDKARLRFSRLTPADIPDLLSAAERHRTSGDGDLDDHDLPDGLRDRLAASSPARITPRDG